MVSGISSSDLSLTSMLTSTNSTGSTSTISTSSTQSTGHTHHGHHRGSASAMFKNISNQVGAGSNGITQADLQSYASKLQSDGQGDSKQAKMIDNMLSNFSKLSDGGSTITASSMQQGMVSLSSSQNTTATQGTGTEPQDPSTVTAEQLQSPIDIAV